MKRWPLLTAAASIVLLPLLLRARQLSTLPEFEPGLPTSSPPWLHLEDVVFARETSRGTLLIRACFAHPGHETVGFFKLGPSTFAELEDVRVTCSRRGDVLWSARGPRARLSPERLRFSGQSSVLGRDGKRRTCKSVTIDLRTGRLSVRQS